MKLVTKEQMRELEQTAIKSYKIPSLLLMENAALGFVKILCREAGRLKNKKIAIFCGKGNNGGDGFAIARKLYNLGAVVTVIFDHAKEQLTEDARINYEIIQEMGVFIQSIKEYEDSPDILIDALLGTGFHGDIKGYEAACINRINLRDGFVAAVDMPSGTFADHGGVANLCVNAHLTVTFGCPKVGHFIYPAKSYVGKLMVTDISIPQNLIEQYRTGLFLLEDSILQEIPKRNINSHKGTFGKVLLFSGSKGMTGACVLAANAVLKSGAGMTTAAVKEEIFPIVAMKLLEVMTLPLPYDETEAFALLNKNLTMQDVLLIGCGLGQSDWAKNLVLKLLTAPSKPIVLDADGINALQGNINILKGVNAPIVLTPHLVEFSRIANIPMEDILRDKVNIAMDFAKEYGVTLVLKGADTVIAHPDGEIYINPISNSGMATAGSGDVLAGMIAGLLAQAIPQRLAVNAGVLLHAQAGLLAKEKFGAYGMTASNLLQYIPFAMKKIEE